MYRDGVRNNFAFCPAGLAERDSVSASPVVYRLIKSRLCGKGGGPGRVKEGVFAAVGTVAARENKRGGSSIQDYLAMSGDVSLVHQSHTGPLMTYKT